jgi:hypothetical protein
VNRFGAVKVRLVVGTLAAILVAAASARAAGPQTIPNPPFRPAGQAPNGRTTNFNHFLHLFGNGPPGTPARPPAGQPPNGRTTNLDHFRHLFGNEPTGTRGFGNEPTGTRRNLDHFRNIFGKGQFTVHDIPARKKNGKIGYHVTDAANVASIKTNGLQPSKPHVGPGGVYYAKNTAGIRVYYNALVREGKRPAVFAIDTSKIDPRTKYKDPWSKSRARYTTKPIAPEHLTLLKDVKPKRGPFRWGLDYKGRPESKFAQTFFKKGPDKGQRPAAANHRGFRPPSPQHTAYRPPRNTTRGAHRPAPPVHRPHPTHVARPAFHPHAGGIHRRR